MLTDDAPIIRWLPRPSDYEPVWHAMRDFTHARDAHTPDEIWLVEHTPVYTLGQAGKREHLLNPDASIPVIQTDRGGQVTYHGPGQLVAYGLIDLRRRGLYVKEYVALLEDCVLDVLKGLALSQARRVAGAPGIYLPFDGKTHGENPSQNPTARTMTNMAKIAALGIKVSQGCAWHGLALNVQMDLRPFSRINPCGYAGLHTTDLYQQNIHLTLEQAAQMLLHHWLQKLPSIK